MQKTESVIRRQDSENHLIGRAKRKKIRKNEESIRDLWDIIKHANICIIEVPEGGEREKKIQKTYLKK